MIPDVASVLRWRALFRAGLRLSGLVAAPIGLAFLTAWAIEGVSDGDFFSLYWYRWHIAVVASCGLWCVVGLVLAGPMTRFLLPLHRPSWPPRCPACRHELVSLCEARCPECGIELPEAFVGWSSPQERSGQGTRAESGKGAA